MTEFHQIEGDCFDALPRLPSNWFHACIGDAPYGWSFMSRAWDRAHLLRQDSAWLELAGWRKDKRLTRDEKYCLWCLGWLKDVYRVLVPGAYAAIFCGAKSYDLLVFAARLAGFDPQPMIVGITGKSMAHGGAVGKLIDSETGAEREISVIRRHEYYSGLGANPRPWSDRAQAAGGGHMAQTGPPVTDLASDFEGHHSRIRDQLMPVALLLKPYEGSLARNAQKWGIAGVNVAGTRIPTEESTIRPRGVNAVAYGRAPDSCSSGSPAGMGRFPGNVLLDSAAAEEVGRQSGWSESTLGRPGPRDPVTVYSGGRDPRCGDTRGMSDNGTATRYFVGFKYINRAPKFERVRGLEHWHWVGDADNPEGWRRISMDEAIEFGPTNVMTGSNHPTLKSLEFTRWVARLLLPPAGETAKRIRLDITGSAGRVLIPFSGVLSEAIGAGLAGWWDIVAIETSSSYVAQGACRWRAWGPYSEARAQTVERSGGVQRVEEHHGQGELFGAAA